MSFIKKVPLESTYSMVETSNALVPFQSTIKKYIDKENNKNNFEFKDKNFFTSKWINSFSGVLDVGWSSVCWSPDLGIFAAVSGATASSDYIMLSFNGINWMPDNTAITPIPWKSICWSSKLMRFCAVSSGTGSGSTNTMTGQLYSIFPIPHIDWSNSTSGVTAADWASVCWSPELEKFCAVSSGYNTMTSYDGVSWSDSTLNVPTYGWTSVCWSPELRKFCAVSATGYSMTSYDGINWSGSATGINHLLWKSVCWSSELGKFCAINVADGSSGYPTMPSSMTSSDGVTWTDNYIGEPNFYMTSVCWSPELMKFCAASATSNIILSSDGITWGNSNRSAGLGWTSICWSPEEGKFCAVSGGAGITTHTLGLKDY